MTVGKTHPTSGTARPAPRMPGATLVTRLAVYDSVAPDGQRGGTPHVHLLCSEMYFVLAGSGAVEMLDRNGFSRVELEPHAALVFTPGTLHRLVNPNGDLELLIVMQNSGLPERGDNVVSFTEAWLENDEVFAKAMHAGSFADAHRRRDRGVEGFLELRAAFDRSLDEGRSALDRFCRRAAERTASQRDGWRAVIERGPLDEARRSLEHVDLLAAGDFRYLGEAQHFSVGPGDYATPGFCGALDRYFDPATLELEGVIREQAPTAVRGASGLGRR